MSLSGNDSWWKQVCFLRMGSPIEGSRDRMRLHLQYRGGRLPIYLRSLPKEKGKIAMCDEEHIGEQLRRNSGEDLTTNLTRDIKAFFVQKYGALSCRFQRMVPQGEDMAQVDFTVSRESEFTRRYVGSAGYVDAHLSLGKVIRLM
jgi:hypothetical protein